MNARVVGIIGTGLIGGSIGLRARRSGAQVLGYDRDPAALAQALEAGALDESADRDALYARSDTVVIAAHLDGTLTEIERLQGVPVGAALVMDVGSVKSPVWTAAQGLACFVATHPMAGSERSGAGAACADLFAGRSWAYVPSRRRALDARVAAFIAMMGAHPVAVDAAEHDRIVALTSHLPQMIAWAFAQRTAATNGPVDALCGPVACELLRLAKADPAMWREIFHANAANIRAELRELIGLLGPRSRPGPDEAAKSH